jgi:DNA end-binding protein Ku
MVLETLYFADEIRDANDLNIPKRTKVPDRELRIADQLIDSLTTEWKPARYEDTYRQRVLDLVRRKGKGQSIDVERPPQEDAKVVDLVEALQRSLDARRPKARARATTKKTAKRTAKKPAKRTRRAS